MSLRLRLVNSSVVLLVLAFAQAVCVAEPVVNHLLGVQDLPQTATTVKDWLAQVQAAIGQVTRVQLNRTDTGLEIVLETQNGKSLQVDATKFRSEGNSLIADIPKALLALPEMQVFNAENPTTDIATVRIVQLNATSIRVSVTGKNALPTSEVTLKTGGLAYSLSPKGETPEEELVVTGAGQDGYFVPNATSATRTDTPIRDIPASIQVIPRQVLEDQQVIRLEEALRNVSGVTFGEANEGQGVDVSIRGFNNAPILRDGFRQYGVFGTQTIPEVANLERIEVLKGPASILFGEIQPGGVINTVTKKPLSNPFYQAEFQIGNRNLFQPRLDFSGPLTSDSKLLYRLNALYEQNDSFRDFDQNFHRILVAPVVTWKISDRTDLSVLLEYVNNEQPADIGRVAIGDQVLYTPRSRITNEPDDSSQTETYNVGYDLEHRFSSNWTVRSAFRYLKRNITQNITFPFSFEETTGIVTRYLYEGEIDNEQYSLQNNIAGKFATGSVNHTLLFGVDLNRTNEEVLSLGLDFSAPLFLDIFNPVYRSFPSSDRKNLPVFSDDRTDTDRLGVYLQDQITLTDSLKLLAGLRYDTVKQKLRSIPSIFNPLGSNTTQTDDAFTPRVGIVYQPIQELSLYGSYSRSFTPNTGTSADGNFLEPEKGEGFEVGIKTDLLTNRLSATLAYFDITKQNVATADLNNLLSFLVATGEQRSRGVELDVAGQILPGWNVIANYAYTDTEVTKDNTIPIGNQLPGIPKHSASLWTTYEIQRGALQGLGIGIGFNYVGERQGDLQNSFRVGSYFLTDTAIFYRRNSWRVGLNFKNIFDIDYTPGVPVARTRIGVGEPFTVIGSIAVQF